MLKLLKSDLLRLYKEKSIYVGFIVIAFFVALNVILMIVLTDGNTLSSEYFLTSGIANFANNEALIIPIIPSIILCSEFSYATIKNKIIAGHKKVNIYLSLLIMYVVASLALLLFRIIIYILVSVVFFDTTNFFNFEVLKHILSILGLSTMIYFTLFSFTVLASFVTKHIGAVIGITIGFIFVLIIISMTLEPTSLIHNFLPILINYEIPFTIKLSDALIMIAANIVYTVAFTLLGIRIFTLTDFK